jgi:hypothetical protein
MRMIKVLKRIEVLSWSEGVEDDESIREKLRMARPSLYAQCQVSIADLNDAPTVDRTKA